jgi:hypothetical protein
LEQLTTQEKAAIRALLASDPTVKQLIKDKGVDVVLGGAKDLAADDNLVETLDAVGDAAGLTVSDWTAIDKAMAAPVAMSHEWTLLKRIVQKLENHNDGGLAELLISYAIAKSVLFR